MTAARMNLLLVEDDPQIQRFLATALDAHGYALAIAGSGAEGLKLAALRQPDILIVDLGLPDMSGLDVIRRVREWCMRPLLVLSARDRESDKVAALDLGADDYLTKPFGIGELLARLRVMQRHLGDRGGEKEIARVDFGDIAVDLAARRVRRNGQDVHLTPIEYQLLATLAPTRSPIDPSVPTARELGTNVEFQFSIDIWAPQGTPRDVINRLSSAISETVKSPAVAEKVGVISMIPQGSTPDGLLRLFQTQMRTYKEAADIIGLQPQ